MKTDIKYFYRNLLTGLAGILLIACDAASDAGLSIDSESIRVYTSLQQTSSEGTSPSPVGENITSCLIFWRDSVYNNIYNETNPWPTPYLVAKPEYPINYYAVKYGNPYDTKRSYPLGNKKVHVMGYAPAAGLYTNDNYRTLIIPDDMQNGKVDFLSGDGNQNRVGSANDPFVTGQTDKEKEKKQLKFCHLTAKINFEARRDKSMSQRIGVQNVKITLKGQQVPASLEWRPIIENASANQEGGYFPIPNPPTESTEKKEIYLTAPTNEKIVMDINQKVDSCYVYAGGEHFHGTIPEQKTDKIELKMDISAELLPFRNEGWDESQKTTRTWKNRTVFIDSKTGNALKMGYAYKVVITFDVQDIRLQGMEVDWDSGGIHYIPITPVEKEGT